MSGRALQCCTSTKQGYMCLAQGHNTVTPVSMYQVALYYFQEINKDTEQTACMHKRV